MFDFTSGQAIPRTCCTLAVKGRGLFRRLMPNAVTAPMSRFASLPRTTTAASRKPLCRCAHRVRSHRGERIPRRASQRAVPPPSTRACGCTTQPPATRVHFARRIHHARLDSEPCTHSETACCLLRYQYETSIGTMLCGTTGAQ